MFRHNEKTILLVEDDPIVALNQKRVLQNNGIHVRVVHSGEKAVQTVENDRAIDMVLLDIHLGEGMDGIETASRILALRELPVVFLTGHAEREMVEKVRSITRYGYVLKNAGEFVLLEAITMAFELFESHQTLKESETHLASILRSAPIGIGIAVDRTIRRVNQHICDMLGYTEAELVGNSVRIMYASDEEFERVGVEKYSQISSTGVGTIETQWRKKDGTVIDVRLSSAPVQSDHSYQSDHPHDNEPHGEYTFVVLDVTEQKQTERKLRDAVNEKTRLFSELNHRVKNNLLMVSSLIMLKESEPENESDLSDLRSRVDTIRRVHEKLSQTDHSVDIDIQTYLPDLLHSILLSAPVPSRPVVETEIDPLLLPAKTAVSVGLIVNELATNAVKYAFVDEPAPRFELQSCVTDHRYTVVVSHNGSNMPPQIDLSQPETLGLGLRLLTTLVAQHNGTIRYDHDAEMNRFTVEIPI